MKKKLYYLLILNIFLIGCTSEYEREINSHFKKYIFIGKFREYKIESIKRRVITVSEDQINSIKASIQNDRYDISLYSKSVVVAKHQLDEIINGKKRFYKGLVYYSTKNLFPDNPQFSSVTIGEELFDIHDEGREIMIENKKKFIEQQYNKIPVIEKKIVLLKQKSDSINKNVNNNIKWINSVVTIKGMEVSGLKRIRYFVQQYSNAEIKNLYVQ